METWTQPPLFDETTSSSERSGVRAPGPPRSSPTTGSAPPIVEPLAWGYTYMRDSRGVMPFAHLIASWAANNASRSLCGRVGSTISNVGVTTMVRCGECDAAQQLLNSGTLFET